MAVADRTGPALTSLTSNVRYTSSYDGSFQALVSFTAGAIDTGTGIDHVHIDLSRARGSYAAQAYTSIDIGNRAGSFLEGPQTAADYSFDVSHGGGTFGIADVKVYDKAGNMTAYDPGQLRGMGIATNVTINGPADVAADDGSPVLTSLSLPGTVAVSGGTATAAFTAGVADVGSGASFAVLEFDHGLVVPLQTAVGATLTNTLTYDQQSPSQTYLLKDAIVYDQAGNFTTYSASQLQARGLATSFTVANPASIDSTAPILNRLNIPGTIDVSHGSSYVAISADVAETGSGIATIALQLSSALTLNYSYNSVSHGPPSGGPILSSQLTGLAPGTSFYGMSIILAQSGDSYRFTFPANSPVPDVPISALTSAGTYHVIGATLTDQAGNSSSYSEAQLQALGANTTISVVADETKPVLTGLSLPGIVVEGSGSSSGSFSIYSTDTGTGTANAVIHFDREITNNYFSPLPGSYLQIGSYSFGNGNNASVMQHFSGSESLGTYNVLDVILTDGGGNQVLYSADQLKAQGFATSFIVTDGFAHDFNGDGHADILWLNRNGAVSTWSATGSGAIDGIRQDTFDARVDTSWRVVDTFDWNGDGASDIVWRNQNGAVSLWTGKGAGFQQSAFNITSVGNDWTIAGTGDLNGDGKGDLLWRNADGSISSWLSTGSGFQQNAYFHVSVGTSWKVEGLGDFNGDTKADILWRNDNGALSVWNSTGSGFQDGSLYHDPVDRSWHVSGVGDFNGDGRDDILWRNDNGAISVWQGTGGAFVEGRMNASAATNWAVADVGDYNGDGLSDILWRNSDGAISIWHSTSTGWQQNTYYDGSVGNDWTVAAHSFPP